MNTQCIRSTYSLLAVLKLWLNSAEKALAACVIDVYDYKHGRSNPEHSRLAGIYEGFKFCISSLADYEEAGESWKKQVEQELCWVQLKASDKPNFVEKRTGNAISLPAESENNRAYYHGKALAIMQALRLVEGGN
jgi:hypothetical protein